MVFYCHIPPAPFYFAKSCFHFKDINSSSHSKTFSPIRHLPFGFMVSFLWYIDLSNFYTVQSIHLLPVACLFDKSLQYPDQRRLIPVSFPPDSFWFYFFHSPLSSIWKVFGFRAWGRALTCFFSKKTPFSPSNGCGFYLEADGESLKKAEQGRDVVRFALREGCCLWHLEVHTDGSPGCGCPEAPPIIPVAFPSSWKVAFGFHRLEKIHGHFGNSSGKCIKSLLRFSKKLTGDIWCV